MSAPARPGRAEAAGRADGDGAGLSDQPIHDQRRDGLQRPHLAERDQGQVDGVDGDVDDFGLGDFDALGGAAVAFGLDDDADGDGGGADTGGLGVEADEVADEDGRVEDDLSHGDRHEAFYLRAAVGLDRARDVNVAEDNAAEDRALRVRVARQQRDADGGVAV